MSDKPRSNLVHREMYDAMLSQRDGAISQRDRLYKAIKMVWESRVPVQLDGRFIRVELEPLKYLVAMLPREDDDV